MTYIEFFDKVSVVNIAACLTYAPERVVLIGTKRKVIDRYIKRYEKIFADRGHNIEFIPRSVSGNNIDHAVSVIQEMIDTYPDCVFDITGGEEILNMALGIAVNKNPDKNIQIHKFNLNTNVLYDCDRDGNTVFTYKPALSVEENIRSYGGDILYGGVFDDETYRWALDDDFEKDIALMWDICRDDPGLWNVQLGVFEGIEKVGRKSSDGLFIDADVSAVKSYLKRNKGEYKIIWGLINALLQKGLLTRFDEDGSDVAIGFKNAQVRRCLTTAGTVLEMRTYLAVRGLKDDDGNPYFNDVMNGVLIDWDGKFHDEKKEKIYDTENEIDVMAMRNLIPVFISCKNGQVKSTELYKLKTVAEKFGGEYAKAVLVATSIPEKGDDVAYLRQRMEDMGIGLIENVRELGDEELASEFKKLGF